MINKPLIFIPAKGTSTGLPGKNLKLFCGYPLFVWSIAAAYQNNSDCHVLVSSDDDKILELSKKFGANPIKRPKNLSTSLTPMVECLKHSIQSFSTKENISNEIVILQPTSPLRPPGLIDEAIYLMKKYNATSVMPLAEQSPKQLFIENQLVKFGYPKGAQRQELKKTYYDCGVIYVVLKSNILNNDFYGNKIRPIFFNKSQCVDIDTPEDFEFARQMFTLNSATYRELFKWIQSKSET